MAEIDFATREVTCKIVYYGPGQSGKTTNLEQIHSTAPAASVGELMSVATEADRTIFFDLLALDMGRVAGMKTKFQLYTVPGQVHYNASRKVVLQGADGVVFVADSGPGKREENLESLENLRSNLRENGLVPEAVPLVFQWNKRDLSGAAPENELAADLNPGGLAAFAATARKGKGVLATLRGIAELVIAKLNRDIKAGGGAAGTAERKAGRGAGAAAPVVCKSPARALLESLVRRGLLPPEDCAPLLEAARVKRRPVCLLMLAAGMVDETTLTEMLIAACNLPYVDLGCYTVEPEVLARLDPALCWEQKVLPLDFAGGTVTLGMVDPLDDRTASRITAPRNISACRAVILASEFERAFNRCYPNWQHPADTLDAAEAAAALKAARAALASEPSRRGGGGDPIGEIPEWFGGELEEQAERAGEDVLAGLPGWLGGKGSAT